MENKPLDLSNLFKTKYQAENFISRLDSISQKIYESSFDLTKTLEQKLGQESKDQLLMIISEQNIDPKNPTEIKKFFDMVKETVEKLPTLDLTVAFEPDTHTLEILSNWFLINLRKHVLLSVKIDHSLIAGGILNYNGKHFDDSVGPKLAHALAVSQQPPQLKPGVS